MSANKFGLFSRSLFRGIKTFEAQHSAVRYYSTPADASSSKITLKTIVKSLGVGCVIGIGYAVYESYRPANSHKIHETAEPFTIDQAPDVPIVRRIVNENDKSNLDLILFQYQTCPFCCKVRAFLDASGFSYSVVEVDAVLRQSIRWSPYKKVPSLLARRKDGKYVQLTESSMIISALATIINDPNADIGELVKLYPSLSYEDDKGRKKYDILNKYFQMFNGEVPKPYTNESIEEERKWREWVDNLFIHLISPNVYRTFFEAIDTFRWFSDAGQWRENFPAWERHVMVYVGAVAMFIISKALKKRHGIAKGQERQHIFSACNQWLGELEKKKTPFMGGNKPNLADLSFYGALTSMEGCATFNDIRQNTKLGTWFDETKKYVNAKRGTEIYPINLEIQKCKMT